MACLSSHHSLPFPQKRTWQSRYDGGSGRAPQVCESKSVVCAGHLDLWRSEEGRAGRIQRKCNTQREASRLIAHRVTRTRWHWARGISGCSWARPHPAPPADPYWGCWKDAGPGRPYTPGKPQIPSKAPATTHLQLPALCLTVQHAGLSIQDQHIHASS